MKKSLFMVLLCFGLTAVANAKDSERKPAGNEVCGELNSSMFSPDCKAGTICPHFVSLQYFVTNDSGLRVNLETKKTSVLSMFAKLKGDYVCATGTNDPANSAYEVNSIRINDMAN